MIKLRDGRGNWVEGPNMHIAILAYFNEDFASTGCQVGALSGLRFPKISNDQNDMLLRPFSQEEIRAVVFSMHPDKAPGPDGMNPKFFQHFWPLVGEDMSKFVSECLDSCSFPPGFGDANVVLILTKS